MGQTFRTKQRLFMLGWGLLVFMLLGLDGWGSWRQAEAMALEQARNNFERDLLYRRWNAGHGGVYVPVTALTPPNPWLDGVADRDVALPGGKRLTLVNPAYMTRQVYVLGEESGYFGHITSLRPLRPGNAPDPWEERALRAFETGTVEVNERVDFRGRPHLRYMKRMLVEERCLKCHAQQGYKVGEVRGGISLAAPLEGYRADAWRQISRIEVPIYGGLLVVGLLAIAAAFRAIEGWTLRLVASEKQILQKAAREWSAALDSYDDAVHLTTADGRLVRGNRAFFRMARKSPEEVLGHTIQEILHPAGGAAECPVCRAMAERRDDSIVLEQDHPSNPAGRPMAVTVRMVRDEEGAVEGIMTQVRDLSAERQAEREKAHLEEQLRQSQKMEAIGLLAGGVAHDFNNILTAIVGYGSMLTLKLEEDDPRRRYAEQILSSSESAASLTHGLLAFSRKQVIHPRPVDLNGVVHKTEKLLRRLIGEDIVLRLEAHGQPLVVLVDPVQMEQVLWNLATNARDAMPGGGVVTVRTTVEAFDATFLRGRGDGRPGRHAVLDVTDTGTGMAEETRQRIFEPFFTTKEHGKGTGLGLAIVYGIVTQSGGFIEAVSAPGQGTTFRIALPLHSGQLEEENRIDNGLLPRGHETVLLAEDDEAIRRFVSSLLQEYGYRVVEATDGEEAVAEFSRLQGKIDAAVLDIIMPRKNGKEVQEALHAARPGLPVLFVSGYAADILETRASFGATVELVSKPVAPSALLQKLRALIDRQTDA